MISSVEKDEWAVLTLRTRIRLRVWGSRTEHFRQVGNAVPPLMAFRIIRHLMDIIGEAD